MELFVNIKQIGSKKQPAAVPFSVEGSPRTAGELIEETVKVCVREYNERVRRGDSSPQPLTKQQIKDMADAGKIAFGINYGGREQDVSKAIENALQAFEDGIFKLFVNGRELCSADEVTDLKDGDVLTFIRLTLLAGSHFY